MTTLIAAVLVCATLLFCTRKLATGLAEVAGSYAPAAVGDEQVAWVNLEELLAEEALKLETDDSQLAFDEEEVY